MLIGELERLHQAQRLVHRSSDRQIVHGNLAQILLAIDDEETTEWNAGLLVEHSVITSDLQRLVGQQRDVQVTETALLARLIDPGKMRKVAVGGAANNFAANVAEFGDTIGVGNDFRGADKSAAKKILFDLVFHSI